MGNTRYYPDVHEHVHVKRRDLWAKTRADVISILVATHSIRRRALNKSLAKLSIERLRSDKTELIAGKFDLIPILQFGARRLHPYSVYGGAVG